MSVQVGDEVKKGQTLFTLVDPQLDLNVTSAQDTLSQDKTAVVQAELKVETDQQSLDTLRASSTSTALQIAVAREQVVADEEAVTSAKAQVSSAQLALDQAKTAAAERAGHCAHGRHRHGGERGQRRPTERRRVDRAAAAALVITDTTQVEAVVSLAETDVAQRARSDRRPRSPSTPFPTSPLAGKVTEVDASGTVNSGVVSYNVTIVPDTTRRLRSRAA